jgi:hypothetical protein
MKIKYLFIVTFLISFNAGAHILTDSIVVKPDSISYWKTSKKAFLIFTQNSFVNWSAGGNNSISSILRVHVTKNYNNTKHLIWSNELKGSYGLNKEAERELRKTEDRFEINSTFGYRKNTESNWYYSAKFNFRTQFSNGYRYPNTEKPISKPFAPAYLFLGVGSEYTLKEQNLRIYISPLTNKTTFVLSKSLANEGAFGVQKATFDENGVMLTNGKRTKMEFGTLFTGEWKTDVMENIEMENKLILYSDYVNNYGNVDVNWEFNLDMTINKYVKANFGTHIRFDDDVKVKKDIDNDGELDILNAKVQLKQILGVGLSYTFK